MTVPLDTRQDIRVMDALGVPRAQIARSLGASRNTVAKYADMEDMSPAAPVPRERPLTAVGPHAACVFGNRKVDTWGCGGDLGPKPSYAASRPKPIVALD